MDATTVTVMFIIIKRIQIGQEFMLKFVQFRLINMDKVTDREW